MKIPFYRKRKNYRGGVYELTAYEFFIWPQKEARAFKCRPIKIRQHSSVGYDKFGNFRWASSTFYHSGRYQGWDCT